MFSQNHFKLFKRLLLVLVLFAPLNSLLAKSLTDPTRPPGMVFQKHFSSVVKRNSPWKLSSTLIASDRKLATVNGKIIRQGDRVNGALLIDIQSWNVTFQKNNKKFKVYMFNKLRIHKSDR